MLDIGMSEMLIVGVVALIVVGPKDLPKMFHTVGEVVGKARGMAREFQSAMSAAAKDAGVDGISKDLRNLKSGKTIKDAVGLDEIDKEMRAIEREASLRDKDTGRKGPAIGAKAGQGNDAAAGLAAERLDDDLVHGFDETSFDDGEFDDGEISGDELEAASHDADLERRNGEMSAVEAARLEKHKKSEEARRKAALIRSKKDAIAAAKSRSSRSRGNEAAEPSDPPASPPSAPTPRAETDET